MFLCLFGLCQWKHFQKNITVKFTVELLIESLSEWVNDSSCFIPPRIRVFKQTEVMIQMTSHLFCLWMIQMTHTQEESLVLSLNEPVFKEWEDSNLFHSRMNQCYVESDEWLIQMIQS